ncbi:MAG: VOC family protein [Deltaproteobacteria bacterium]|nr:VOC family protein [Deltaproteobacteria bacterium]
MADRLSLVILAVRDLSRATRFYADVFGWSVAVEVPVYVEFALPDGMRLGLYQRDAFIKNTDAPATPRLAGHTTATELYLTVDDLVATIARLAAADAPCRSPLAPRPWGDTAAYYEDPDGNVVVVARPTVATG